jgi:hypothetical protein
MTLLSALSSDTPSQVWDVLRRGGLSPARVAIIVGFIAVAVVGPIVTFLNPLKLFSRRAPPAKDPATAAPSAERVQLLPNLKKVVDRHGSYEIGALQQIDKAARSVQSGAAFPAIAETELTIAINRLFDLAKTHHELDTDPEFVQLKGRFAELQAALDAVT